MKLKYQRFADEYLLSGNATQSAILAGYSEKTARTTGRRLLQNDAVAEYLSRQQNKASEKTLTRREKIIAELEKLAFANIEDFTTLDADGRRIIDFSRATREQLAALQSLKTKTRHIYTPKGEHIGTEHNDQFNMADKYRGLELLGKVEGMFQEDKVKVTIDVADRLLSARARLQRIGGGTEQQSDDDEE